MMRKKKFRRGLFEQKPTIDDFSIPEFLNWFGQQDISKYVKIVKVPIENEDKDITSMITVVEDVDGMSVTLDGVTVQIGDIVEVTNMEGQCILHNLPEQEAYLVNLTKEGYIDHQELVPAESINSVVITMLLNNESEEPVEEPEIPIIGE